jgi:hypothetical protein
LETKKKRSETFFTRRQSKIEKNTATLFLLPFGLGLGVVDGDRGDRGAAARDRNRAEAKLELAVGHAGDVVHVLGVHVVRVLEKGGRGMEGPRGEEAGMRAIWGSVRFARAAAPVCGSLPPTSAPEARATAKPAQR